MPTDQPPRPFATRLIKPALGCTACLAAVALILAITLFYGSADYRAYNALNFDMDIAEVEDILEHSPEYSCRFQSYTVYYFFVRQREFDEHKDLLTDKSLFPDVVESLEDFPIAYATIWVMVNAEGLVVAYSWMGEEYDIHTSIGDFPGTLISQLPDDFFNKLSSQIE